MFIEQPLASPGLLILLCNIQFHVFFINDMPRRSEVQFAGGRFHYLFSFSVQHSYRFKKLCISMQHKLGAFI